MRNWDVHGYNNDVCNVWKEPEPDVTKTEAKQNLDKWLFYFDRFNNHEISARLDEELCTRTEEKMVEWQETSKMSWIEVRHLHLPWPHEGIDTILYCSQDSCAMRWSNLLSVV